MHHIKDAFEHLKSRNGAGQQPLIKTIKVEDSQVARFSNLPSLNNHRIRNHLQVFRNKVRCLERHKVQSMYSWLPNNPTARLAV